MCIRDRLHVAEAGHRAVALGEVDAQAGPHLVAPRLNDAPPQPGDHLLAVGLHHTLLVHLGHAQEEVGQLGLGLGVQMQLRLLEDERAARRGQQRLHLSLIHI